MQLHLAAHVQGYKLSFGARGSYTGDIDSSTQQTLTLDDSPPGAENEFDGRTLIHGLRLSRKERANLIKNTPTNSVLNSTPTNVITTAGKREPIVQDSDDGGNGGRGSDSSDHDFDSVWSEDDGPWSDEDAWDDDGDYEYWVEDDDDDEEDHDNHDHDESAPRTPDAPRESAENHPWGSSDDHPDRDDHSNEDHPNHPNEDGFDWGDWTPWSESDPDSHSDQQRSWSPPPPVGSDNSRHPDRYHDYHDHPPYPPLGDVDSLTDGMSSGELARHAKDLAQEAKHIAEVAEEMAEKAVEQKAEEKEGSGDDETLKTVDEILDEGNANDSDEDLNMEDPVMPPAKSKKKGKKGKNGKKKNKKKGNNKKTDEPVPISAVECIEPNDVANSDGNRPNDCRTGEIEDGQLCVYPWQCKSQFCCPYLKVGWVKLITLVNVEWQCRTLFKA